MDVDRVWLQGETFLAINDKNDDIVTRSQEKQKIVQNLKSFDFRWW